MSCGKTDEGVIDALMRKIPQYGLKPFHVLRESDGFIFNRVWASIKRECRMAVEEGVATPEDVGPGRASQTRVRVWLGSRAERPCPSAALPQQVPQARQVRVAR